MGNIAERAAIKFLEGLGSWLSPGKRERLNHSRDAVPIGRARHLYHANREETVYLSTEERLRHTYVIGASGSGKTRLLEHMMREDVLAARGFALLDVHGDVTESMLRFIAGLAEEER